MEYQLVNKLFKCENCLKQFKKLVSPNELIINCISCGELSAVVLEANEFNREPVDRSYSMTFDNRQSRPQNTNRNQNPFGSSNTSRQNNVQQTNRVPERQASQRNIRQSIFFTPFITFFSPFTGMVNSSYIQEEQLFNDGFVFYNYRNGPAFRDNFASNFSSNFMNRQDRAFTFIRMFQQRERENEGTPTPKTVLENLKKFDMSKEYCKKNDDKLEQPNCCVCLTDIEMKMSTVLLPCGHMFHDQCIKKWLEQHNTCPLCRFELKTV